jgi:cell division protein FtsB
MVFGPRPYHINLSAPNTETIHDLILSGRLDEVEKLLESPNGPEYADMVALLAKYYPQPFQIKKCDHSSYCNCNDGHPIIRCLEGSGVCQWLVKMVSHLIFHTSKQFDHNSKDAQRIEELEKSIGLLKAERNEMEESLKELEGSLGLFEFDKIMEEDSLKKKIKSLQDSVAFIKDHVDTLKQTLLETRKLESRLLSGLFDPSNNAILSLESLKHIGNSLTGRLNALKEKVEPTRRPSNAQLLLPYLLNDPDVSKDSLCQCIKTLESELLEVESNFFVNLDETPTDGIGTKRQGEAAANAAGVRAMDAVDIPQRDPRKKARVSESTVSYAGEWPIDVVPANSAGTRALDAVDSPENTSRKRARVSVSPFSEE